MTKLLAVLVFLLPAVAAAQTTNFAARNGQSIVAFSATPAFDAGKANAFKITLTANVTSSTLIGAEAGQWITLEICQDGAGAHTFVPPAQWQGFQTIGSGVNVCTGEVGQFDGTNVVNPTTATGGGGSGTVNSATVNQLARYTGTGTTVGGSSSCTDDLTTMTCAGSGGVAAGSFNTNTAGAGFNQGTEGACPTPVAGKDFLCLGDVLSHSAKVSDNGNPFLTVPIYSNDSPTPFGPLYADSVFPRVISSPVGAAGQAFISSGPASAPAYGALDLSSPNNVINRLPKANLATTVVHTDQVNSFGAAGTLDLSASTAANSFRLGNVAGFSTTTNGVMGYNTTTNNFIGGMNSGNSVFPVTTVTPLNNNCAKWVITSGNFQLGDAGAPCGGGGGSPALSAITAATVGNTIDNVNNAQVWRWQLSSAGAIGFRWSETAASTSTGTPWLAQFDTVASSTLNPFKVTAAGTTNGIGVLKSGFLTSLGVGGVDSNLLFCDVTTSTKCAQLALSGITAANTRLVTIPDAASTTVVADTGASNNFLTAISSSGGISKAQPAFSNISGAATAAQLPANVKIRSFGTSFGDTLGSALTSGSIVYRTVPYACTISAWNMTLDAGTATIDIWKIATGTAIPTVTNTITAAALPAISSGTALHSTTLTGWTTSVTANDIFGFKLNAVSTAKYVNIDVECDQ